MNTKEAREKIGKAVQGIAMATKLSVYELISLMQSAAHFESGIKSDGDHPLAGTIREIEPVSRKGDPIDQRCCKCGNEAAHIHYDSHAEKMDLECATCKYKWESDPLDKEKEGLCLCNQKPSECICPPR